MRRVRMDILRGEHRQRLEWGGPFYQTPLDQALNDATGAALNNTQVQALVKGENTIANILSSTGEGTCAPCKQIFGQHEPRSNEQLKGYYFGDSTIDSTDMDIDRDNYTQLFCGYEDMPGQENKSWAWRIPPQGICVINNLRPPSPGEGDFWESMGDAYQSAKTSAKDTGWEILGVVDLIEPGTLFASEAAQHNFAEDGRHRIEPQSSPFFVANKFECEALGFQYSDNKLPIGYGEEGDAMVPKNYEYYPLDHDAHIKQADPSPSPGEKKIPDIIGNYLKRKYSAMAKKDSYFGKSMKESSMMEHIIDEEVEGANIDINILTGLGNRWKQWSWGTILDSLSFGRFCPGGSGRGDAIFGTECESWDTKEIVRQKFESTNVCNSDDFILAGTGIDIPDPNAISNTAGLNQCGYKQKTPNHCCPKMINSQNCPLFQDDLRIIPASPPDDGWTTNWIKKNNTNSSHCYDIFEFPWPSGEENTVDSFFSSNGGISCHKRDGSSAVVDRTVSISSPSPNNPIEYSFVDVNRPITDDNITSLDLDEQLKGSYWGTRAKIDSTHPYKENSDSGATGYEHYIDPTDYIRLPGPKEGEIGWLPEEKNEYISQNKSKYILDYQLSFQSDTHSETERKLRDSWSFSKSTVNDIIGDAVYGDSVANDFKGSGGRPAESPFTRYSTLNIDPNITDGSFEFYSCRGKDQKCSDLEKTQYMQQIYDKKFCRKYPDNLFDEDEGLDINKFYRPVGINNQGENISSPNKLNYPDICCDNIEDSDLSAFIGCDAEGRNPYFIDDIIGTPDEATIPTKETCATPSTGSSPCENWNYGTRERITVDRGENVNYNQCNKYTPRTCYGVHKNTSSPDLFNKDCYYKIRNFLVKNKHGGTLPGTEREEYLHPGAPTGKYPNKSCIDECKTNACGTGPLTDPVESCGACEPYSEPSPSCFPGAKDYPVYFTDNYLQEICETDYPEIKGTNCKFIWETAYNPGFVPRKNKDKISNWNRKTGPSNKFDFTIEQPFDTSDDVSPVYNECVKIPIEYNILDIEIYDKKIDWAPDNSPDGNIRYVGSIPPNDLPIKVRCSDEYDTPIISSPIKDPSKDIYYYDVRCPRYNHSGRQDQYVPTRSHITNPSPSPSSPKGDGSDEGLLNKLLELLELLELYEYLKEQLYKFLALIGVSTGP